MPVEPAIPVVTLLVCFLFRAQGCGCGQNTRHSLRPLSFRGLVDAALGRESRRGKVEVCLSGVIAIQFTLRHSGMRRKAQARNPFLPALARLHGFRVRSLHSRPGMTAWKNGGLLWGFWPLHDENLNPPRRLRIRR